MRKSLKKENKIMNAIQKLAKLSQSVWYDNISRSLISTGKLKELIELGLLGMTSNPTIFDKSISGSNDYDDLIGKLAKKKTFDIYDELTMRDVGDAADIFRSVYDKTQGLDGYVSLEVRPDYAAKTKETVAEAKRLFASLNRPNVMIKIPATAEGLPAVTEVLALGINVNVTLIFSCEQYAATANAFINGLNQLAKNGGDIKKIASVASVFVSRIDGMVDKAIIDPKLEQYKGKAAVANSKLIYQQYKEIFSSSKWQGLVKKGARPQRVLWASTGTKDPAYSDIKYVEELVASNTVNTMPSQAWDALLDHGESKIQPDVIEQKVEEAKAIIKGLGQGGIKINQVCDKLLADGVVSFDKSFQSLLTTIENKVKQFK
jgi:transaldolase